MRSTMGTRSFFWTGFDEDITVDITVDIEEILQNFAAKHPRR